MKHLIYLPQYFSVQELVPPEIFHSIGDKALLLFDPNALRALDAIRELCGIVIVNNWEHGGTYKESGLRSLTTGTGAPKSAHKAGQAFDLKFKSLSPRQAFDRIMAQETKFAKLISRIEHLDATPTWLHFDTVPHAGTGTKIRVFRP